MKLLHWPRLFFITIPLSLELTAATAETNETHPFRPRESPVPQTKAPATELSGRDVYRRISEQTGGLYRFKTNPSAEDYRKFLNDALVKPAHKKPVNK